MSTQVLQLPPSYAVDISLEYQEIQRFYAGGHDKTEVVGPTDGIIILGFSYGHLPAAGLTVNDPEAGGAATPWAKYLWKFYKYRKADQQPFTVTIDDPETNTTMTQLFKFADSRLSYQQITFKLYTSAGLQMRQYRALA
jgi:hypothetical protein